MGIWLRVLFPFRCLASPGKDLSSCGCSSKQKASCGTRMGLCCPLPTLRCYHMPAEGGWMRVPSPAASALLRRSKCQAPDAVEECLPTFPTPSSGAGWQAKEKSSPATVLAACCSAAVTGCVVLPSGGKGGYVRSGASVLASAPLCTASQLPEGRAEREEQQGCTQLLSLLIAAFGICWCTSVG